MSDYTRRHSPSVFPNAMLIVALGVLGPVMSSTEVAPTSPIRKAQLVAGKFQTCIVSAPEEKDWISPGSKQRIVFDLRNLTKPEDPCQWSLRENILSFQIDGALVEVQLGRLGQSVESKRKGNRLHVTFVNNNILFWDRAGRYYLTMYFEGKTYGTFLFWKWRPFGTTNRSNEVGFVRNDGNWIWDCHRTAVQDKSIVADKGGNVILMSEYQDDSATLSGAELAARMDSFEETRKLLAEIRGALFRCIKQMPTEDRWYFPEAQEIVLDMDRLSAEDGRWKWQLQGTRLVIITEHDVVAVQLAWLGNHSKVVQKGNRLTIRFKNCNTAQEYGCYYYTLYSKEGVFYSYLVSGQSSGGRSECNCLRYLAGSADLDEEGAALQSRRYVTGID